MSRGGLFTRFTSDIVGNFRVRYAVLRVGVEKFPKIPLLLQPRIENSWVVNS